MAVITEHSSCSANESAHFPLTSNISMCLPDLSPSTTKTRWLTLISGIFQPSMSYLTTWEGRGVVKSQDLVSLSQAFSFILFWVIHTPSLFPSPSLVVSLHHAFIFLLPHSSSWLPCCSSIRLLPAHISSHSLSSRCVCCQSLSLVPLHFLLFPTNFSVSQFCTFLLFFTSLSHDPSIWDKNLPHVQSPVVRMNLGK